MCLLVCALRLYPATPGCGVRRGFVCLGSGFGCAPALLAGVLGCGSVCLGSGFGYAPPLLAGVLGCVRVCVRAPLVPRHSWLGCAAWVCVLGLGFRLRPAIPGWGVGACVCWCSRSACTPPLLAGVCGVVLCAWARVSAAPRHAWLGCWGVCVLVCALRLYPATPGWGVWCGCVCLCSGFGCALPLLAGVLGCVCACVPVPLVPRHSWLGCVAWVCVFGLGFRLCPATPGWGVRACVCWCSRSACTPPLLAGVCSVGVCVWARISGAPRYSWLGFLGVCVLICVLLLYPATPGWGVRCGCACSCSGFGSAPPLLAGVFGVWVGCCLAPVPVPWFVVCCARCPGLRHPVAVVAWHVSSCRGCGQQRASLACLLAPRWCTAPRQVRSLPVLWLAFPSPWCLFPPRRLAPPPLLGGCAGHAEAGREPGSFCLPLAPAEGRWARSASYPFGAPR